MKNKKKLLSIVLVACLCFCAAGCNKVTDTNSSSLISTITEIETEKISAEAENSANDNVSEESNMEISSEAEIVSSDSSAEENSSQSAASNCSHSYTNIKIEQTAELFKAGTKRYICEHCGDSYTKQYPVEKIKLLSIGNSYSEDGLWQIYDICKFEGVQIDVAIMYIPGCSVDQHWENIQKNNATYLLHRNNNGTWTTTENYSIEAILQEQWDVIAFQNNPGWASVHEGFVNVDNLINYVAEKQPDAILEWYLTWAHKAPSEDYFFDKHGKDETVMYNKIVECVKEDVITNPNVDCVVPVGTAVHNARTSNLKNDMHRDDAHLSYELGRYVAAYTWYCHLTGQEAYSTHFAANSISGILSDNELNIVLESAKNAIKNPYQITQSYYK